MKTTIVILAIAASAFALSNCTISEPGAGEGSAAGSAAGYEIGKAAQPAN